jgi:methyl-accepting chemotaxis protein
VLRRWLGGTLRGWAERLAPSPLPALPPPLPFVEAAPTRARSVPPPDPSPDELNARAVSLLEGARSDVLGRIKVVNETTERATLAVGDALHTIVKEARAQTEEARAALQQLSGAGAGNAGVPQLAARQSRAVTEYLQRMSGIITRHDETVQSSHESSQHIAAIGKSVEKVAFQARLLSLNAAIEAARLGGQGGAFGVIADEMTRLSTEMDVANRKISDLAATLLKCLPEIAAQSTDLRDESATFSERMNQELVELQESSARFERRVTDTLTSGDERVARVVSSSHEALSHLSFQDACSQRLLSIDSVLKQLARRLTAASDDSDASFEDVQRNSMFNAGEVISLRDASETASDEPSATADAGEVMLF